MGVPSYALQLLTGFSHKVINKFEINAIGVTLKPHEKQYLANIILIQRKLYRSADMSIFELLYRVSKKG